MARILITSGPTRQYLDPVRYISNGSSGRMGACLAQKAIDAGHSVTIVSGPVAVDYPSAAAVVWVETTEQMLKTTQVEFASHDGLIGAAAPCDYMPRQVESTKITKDGRPLQLELIETPDVVATVAQSKRSDQWVVGFALETEDRRFRAIVKMQRKCCDLMVSNGQAAINSEDNDIEILAPDGSLIIAYQGTKMEVATAIIETIEATLIRRSQPSTAG